MFLKQKGKFLQRKVYTILMLLADLGGMEDALTLLFTPFVAGIAARAFRYDLVSRHMKVKVRSKVHTEMPNRHLSQKDAQTVMRMAGI